MQVKSYLRDITDFLDKIINIKTILQNTIMVTLDMNPLYSNIKHVEVITVLKEILDKKTKKNSRQK